MKVISIQKIILATLVLVVTQARILVAIHQPGRSVPGAGTHTLDLPKGPSSQAFQTAVDHLGTLQNNPSLLALKSLNTHLTKNLTSMSNEERATVQSGLSQLSVLHQQSDPVLAGKLNILTKKISPTPVLEAPMVKPSVPISSIVTTQVPGRAIGGPEGFSAMPKKSTAPGALTSKPVEDKSIQNIMPEQPVVRQPKPAQQQLSVDRDPLVDVQSNAINKALGQGTWNVTAIRNLRGTLIDPQVMKSMPPEQFAEVSAMVTTLAKRGKIPSDLQDTLPALYAAVVDGRPLADMKTGVKPGASIPKITPAQLANVRPEHIINLRDQLPLLRAKIKETDTTKREAFDAVDQTLQKFIQSNKTIADAVQKHDDLKAKTDPKNIESASAGLKDQVGVAKTVQEKMAVVGQFLQKHIILNAEEIVSLKRDAGAVGKHIQDSMAALGKLPGSTRNLVATTIRNAQRSTSPLMSKEYKAALISTIKDMPVNALRGVVAGADAARSASGKIQQFARDNKAKVLGVNAVGGMGVLVSSMSTKLKITSQQALQAIKDGLRAKTPAPAEA